MPARAHCSDLTPERQAEAERIRLALLTAADGDIRELATLLARADDTKRAG